MNDVFEGGGGGKEGGSGIELEGGGTDSGIEFSSVDNKNNPPLLKVGADLLFELESIGVEAEGGGGGGSEVGKAGESEEEEGMVDHPPDFLNPEFEAGVIVEVEAEVEATVEVLIVSDSGGST